MNSLMRSLADERAILSSVVWAADNKLYLGAEETATLFERVERRHRFLGPYRTIRNKSLQNYAHVATMYTDGLLAQAELPLLVASGVVERHLGLLLARPESRRSKLLVDYTVLPGTLAETRKVVKAIDEYLPLVLRREGGPPQPERYDIGRELDEMLLHARRTAWYMQGVSASVTQMLSSYSDRKRPAGHSVY
jgi:hypothetical protein